MDKTLLIALLITLSVSIAASATIFSEQQIQEQENGNGVYEPEKELTDSTNGVVSRVKRTLNSAGDYMTKPFGDIGTVVFYKTGEMDIYDFTSNETGILDLDTKRCFVMPLNRSQVLQPENLSDFVEKERTGYYDLDFSVLRQSMRVVTPPITDTSKLGKFIQRDCQKYPIYKLEKIEQPRIQKRSADMGAENVYTLFNGKATQIQLVNLHEVDEYEQKYLNI